jgi:hypothetical protein
VTIENSTITGNTNGGIGLSGDAYGALAGVTLSNNGPSNLKRAAGTGAVTLTSTLLTITGSGVDCDGAPVTDDGNNNAVSDGSCALPRRKFVEPAARAASEQLRPHRHASAAGRERRNRGSGELHRHRPARHLEAAGFAVRRRRIRGAPAGSSAARIRGSRHGFARWNRRVQPDRQGGRR